MILDVWPHSPKVRLTKIALTGLYDEFKVFLLASAMCGSIYMSTRKIYSLPTVKPRFNLGQHVAF